MLKKAIFGLAFIMTLQTTFTTEEKEIRLGVLETLSMLGNLSALKTIDLTDKNVLSPLLAEPFQDEESVSKALEIVKSVYEVNPRAVETDLSQPTKFGLVFPINPEIMKNLMEHVKGKIVLTIADASGENSILLALAGAEHVYMNDIEPNEVRKFNQKKETLPVNLQNCLTSLCCDIFDLATHHAELLSSIDMIYCRNFLHFLTDKKQAIFFPLLKSFLKPGSQIVFSVNSAYLDSYSPLITENPLVTRFSRMTCQLFNHDNSLLPVAQIFTDVSVCEEDLDPLDFEKYVFLKKLVGSPETGGTNGKWSINQGDVDRAGEKIASRVNKERQKEEIKKLLTGQNMSIELVKNTARAYTAENLQKLFEDNGFVIEKYFFLSQNGHETSKYFKPCHVGVFGFLPAY